MTGNAPLSSEPGFDAEAARIVRYAYVSALDESAGAAHLLRMLSCPARGSRPRAWAIVPTLALQLALLLTARIA